MKIKNKLAKTFIYICVLLLGLFFSLTFISGNIVLANEMKSVKSIVSLDKVYSNAKINDDFDCDSIIVVLDRTISGVNKRHDPSFFGKEGIVSIEDLTAVTDSTTVIDKQNWEQVLLINFAPNRSLNADQEGEIIDNTQLKKIDVLSRVSLLKSIDGIKFVGPNRMLEIEKEPNDPMFINMTDAEQGQWSLQRIQASLAWETHIGSNNVRVGIIDTGVGNLVNGNSNHPDLNANLIAGVANGAGDYINFNTNANCPGMIKADTNGHGTHVAGIVGAVGDNGIGVSGVNWNISLVPMQVATGSFISDAACVRAVNWARNNWNTPQRISILQFSIGGEDAWADLEVVIRQYSNLGGLFVCSTGNKNQDNDIVHHYPSFYASDMHTNPIANMIAVGRSDINDERPTGFDIYANWGRRTITLFAPGHNIVSTYPVDVDSNFGVGYHMTSGSSMATPMVSGVAALLLSANPNLTGGQLKAAIVNNVDIVEGINNSPTLGRICVTGGRLNAYKALMSVLLVESEGIITGVSPNVTLLGNLKIPKFINGRLVTKIGNFSFSGQNQLTQITIPSTVTHIENYVFKDTNNAPIYLEDRLSVPNTFSVNWNSSGNPIYLSDNLCTHPSTTIACLDYMQHGQLCDDCRTFVSKNNHAHNHKYTPFGTSPSGIAVHLSFCECGDYNVTPCSSRIPHEPGDMVICRYCGQVFSNPTFYTIALTNGEVFVSNIPFTYEMYEELSIDLGLVYSYNTYLLESFKSKKLYLERNINKTFSLLHNIKNYDYIHNDYFNNYFEFYSGYYKYSDYNFVLYIERKKIAH